MARLEQAFNRSEVTVREREDFSPLPDGTYRCRLVALEVKDTKAGDGCYFACSWDVVGPTHQGRKVWSTITHRNPSARAEAIGNEQLAILCDAAGVAILEDTDQLVGCTADLTLTTAEGMNGKPRNEVRRYAVPKDAAPAKKAAAPTTAGFVPPASADAPAPSVGGNKPPWAK